MNNKRQRRLAVSAGGLGLAVLLGLQATAVIAEEATVALGDGLKSPFTFSVSQAFHRDNNLYRLPSSTPSSSVPKGKRGDTFSVTRASVDFDSQQSRQVFHAGLSVGHTAYKTHSRLNTTTPEARLRWDWRIGDRWSGVLGHNYTESPVSFDDNYTGQNAADRERITRRLHRTNASADFWWHPNWATGIGLSNVSSDYRNSEVYNRDKYNAQTASLNVTYRPATGNRIVFGVSNEKGQYPNRKKKGELLPWEESLRDWEQRDARVSAYWRLTGVTHLSGYIGYTKRKYDLARNRDFSGGVGKVTFHWMPTGKAIVDLSWRREIGADMDSVSNYAVSQGWSLQPTWIVTSKVRIGASYEYLSRDYGGDPGSVSWIGDRPKDAKTQTYGLNVRYLPIPSAHVALGYQSARRDAKADAFKEYYSYRARSIWLSGGMTF